MHYKQVQDWRISVNFYDLKFPVSLIPNTLSLREYFMFVI
jgi:hypothetical protein